MLGAIVTRKLAGIAARHVLTAAGAYLVAEGYADQSAVDAMAGGGVALAGVVWSVLEKIKR